MGPEREIEDYIPARPPSRTIEEAVDRLLATYYRTMPAWMRWLDGRLRWWRSWLHHPYIVVWWRR